MQDIRQDYKTGFVDKWNTIGVVDGRMLPENMGFYLPMNKGRRVTVGEIQAYPTNDGEKTSYRMTAVINNQLISREISKDDYNRFLNYDDEHRLQLFDKVFEEVKIKSASNGQLEDKVYSGNIDSAKGVVSLKGDYCLISGKSSAAITAAMAWKDEISGDYLINLRTNKDAGMWSFKISQEQYNKFQYATDEERASLFSTLLPSDAKSNEKMKVVAASSIYQGGYMREQNANISPKPDRYNLNDIREQTKINLLGDAYVNGESLENLKASKEWKRSGEHGRDTQVGDIVVEKLKDAKGQEIEGKYKMTAVIDGNVFSHEITEKQYNKFMTVNNLQRMKLFDKIFPEVEMKTKPENRFNLGAALLAAVTTGVGVMAIASESRPHHSPVVFESGPVFSKPGVVSAAEVSASIYESMNNGPAPSEGYGLGR